jgi:hypothetical protein
MAMCTLCTGHLTIVQETHCWSGDTLEWAKAEGCTSLLSDSDYDSEYDDDA